MLRVHTGRWRKSGSYSQRRRRSLPSCTIVPTTRYSPRGASYSLVTIVPPKWERIGPQTDPSIAPWVWERTALGTDRRIGTMPRYGVSVEEGCR